MLDHRLQGAETDVAGGPLHDPVGPIRSTCRRHPCRSLPPWRCRSPSGRTSGAAVSRRTRARPPGRPRSGTRRRPGRVVPPTVRPRSVPATAARGLSTASTPSGALRAIAAASSRPVSSACPGSHRRTTRPWSNAACRAERCAGQRHLGHHGLGQVPRQAEQRAAPGEEAEADLGRPEDGVDGRHDEVGDQGEFEPTAERNAFHRGDQRFAAAVAEHVVDPRRAGPTGRRPSGPCRHRTIRRRR